MRVLVGCECSGVVREAFRARGHDAWSCDLKPAEDDSPHHLQCDVLTVMDRGWDLGIFHPECRYLCSSGIHWNKRDKTREAKTYRARKFVRNIEFGCMLNIPKWCIENSIGILSTQWRKPDQIIQPYLFGHDASKSTALWLHNLPKLQGTSFVHPRGVCNRCEFKIIMNALNPGNVRKRIPCPRCDHGRMLPRWSNQTDTGQNRLGPSETRSADRARTYTGIGKAMAEQWG